MARWMVNVRGQQFSAGSLDELKQLAKKGEISAGDIVQPPGAADWIYAMEVPELKKMLREDAGLNLDAPVESPGMSTPVKAVIAGVMGLVSVGLWVYALQERENIPDPNSIDLLGGEKGLQFSEVLVTDAGPLRQSASVAAPETGKMEKNGKCDLLAKRGRWYKLRCNGAEGYAEVDKVVPAYFFADDKIRKDYDPLYNPDRYITIANSAWRESSAGSKTSNFSFLIQNNSKFPMTDVKLIATIKDKTGHEIQSLEMPVEGIIPPQEGSMIGTLKPAKNAPDAKTNPGRVMVSAMYQEELKTDPKLSERWMDGVEVSLNDEDLEATIDIVEVRALQAEKGK